MSEPGAHAAHVAVWPEDAAAARAAHERAGALPRRQREPCDICPARRHEASVVDKTTGEGGVSPVDAERLSSRASSSSLWAASGAIAGSSPARRWPAVTHQQQSVLGTGAGKKIIVVDAVVDDRDIVAGGAQPAADAFQHLVGQRPQLAPSASSLRSQV